MTGAESGAIAGSIVVAGMVAIKGVSVWLERRNSKNGSKPMTIAECNLSRSELTEAIKKSTEALSKICRHLDRVESKVSEIHSATSPEVPGQPGRKLIWSQPREIGRIAKDVRSLCRERGIETADSSD